MSATSHTNRHVPTKGGGTPADGSIDMIIGPMFSGKTTELLRRVRRNLAASKKCILIKYKGDIRYGQDSALSTHDKVNMTAKSAELLTEIENAAWHYDVIAIDEGQFFSGNASETCSNCQ